MESTIRTRDEPGSPRQGEVSFPLIFEQDTLFRAGHGYTVGYLPLIGLNSCARLR
jgi:hypothetical protein